MNNHPVRTDEALMAQLATGELDAAAVLFRRYKAGLFHFFLRMGFPRDTSEDMVQTVFERIIKYRQSYRTELRFRAWMYQIARNVQSDQFRQQPGTSGNDFSSFENREAGQEKPVSQVLETEETVAQLEKALKQLPADQLEILLLTRYQGLKYAEAGMVLGCSEGAVKLKVFRALQQLRMLFFKMEKL